MATIGHLTPSRSSPNFLSTDHDVNIEVVTKEDGNQYTTTHARQRRGMCSDSGVDRPRSRTESQTLDDDSGRFESDFVLVSAENAIEAHRMINNYKFGFKKWKSHVTFRPLSKRSAIVKDLYADIGNVRPVQVSTLRPTNILYVMLFGWWIALVYLLVAVLMAITIIGIPYVPFCWRMSKYFLWPFGKFLYLMSIDPTQMNLNVTVPKKPEHHGCTIEEQETTSLLPRNGSVSKTENGGQHISKSNVKEFLTSFRSYPWLLLGLPVLFVVHGVVAFITWFFVVTIPIAKVNGKTLTQVLWMAPDRLHVGDSNSISMDPKKIRSEIIMYTHQFVNIYYYKYTVDGMNVILVNLLVFVVVSLVIGYIDPKNKITNGVVKCVLAVLAIVPLTYYIGMAIISISAQSSFAIGAVLNATFGSIVELILYVVALIKGEEQNSSCYFQLVLSALTGTLVGSILFIPGICMIVGGVKFTAQKFNPKSASVTALLLFVAIGGVFAPTIFSKIFGDMQCKRCEVNTTVSNQTAGLQCTGCTQSLVGLDGDNTLYNKHIEPLVYACALVLPIAYVIGVLFTLKTHTSYVYDEFYSQMSVDAKTAEGHGAPQWSRIKSIIILLVSAVLIALCSDLITDNIQELLDKSGVSEKEINQASDLTSDIPAWARIHQPFLRIFLVLFSKFSKFYFIGVTMIAMVPELPEIINGIQFTLQNNVNLGIEIGTNTAIQVCMIQVPALVLINLIYPLGFTLVFNDVHLWAVIFSVIVINYIFQDGKTDYFQGSALVAIYVILLCMYFFVPLSENSTC